MFESIVKKHWIHYLLIFVGVFCISWSAILVKLAEVSGLASAFYRMFFGTLGIIPIWLYYRKPITSKKGVLYAVLCGVLFASDIALWNTSILLSKASVSTLLANLAPVWVGLGALMFMKEKPTRLFWVGTFIAITGVAIIVGINDIAELSLTTGNLLAITASVFYGAYLITVRKGRAGLDTFSFTAISMVSSTVTMGLICFVSDTQLTDYQTHSWVYLILLGLVPQVVGWLAINQALGHIKPTVASVSLLSQSVFTAIFAYPILHETLTMGEISGAALVLVGIYLVNKKTGN
ncbi:MAG: DMT family transporter [Paludibacter sp.]|nr:DMT family transporter [Paludibacter sp.]